MNFSGFYLNTFYNELFPVKLPLIRFKLLCFSLARTFNRAFAFAPANPEINDDVERRDRK
jgi:hypothetical protein